MRKNERGQYLVEFVLSLGIWLALFSGMVFVGTILIIKQRGHQIARYGTMLQTLGRLSDEVVAGELESYARALSGSRPNPWTIETGRFLETPASRFYRLFKTRVTAEFPSTDQHFSEVVVCQQEGSSL